MPFKQKPLLFFLHSQKSHDYKSKHRNNNGIRNRIRSPSPQSYRRHEKPRVYSRIRRSKSREKRSPFSENKYSRSRSLSPVADKRREQKENLNRNYTNVEKRH